LFFEGVFRMDDVVVFIPGISGSVLTKNDKTVWAPQAGAALRGAFTGLRTIRSLKMEGDDHTLDVLGDGVKATGLCQDLHIVPGLWKIDGYTAMRRNLFQRLNLVEGETYFEMPYDWRRDNRVAARKLQRLSEQVLAKRRKTHPKAQLILICHSMGGIIARLFLETLEGWRDTKRLFTLGTPYSGSLNSLDNLSNGFKMGLWVLQADLTETLSSFTSVYQLLPSYRCFHSQDSGEMLALDAPGVEIPGLDTARLADALALHRNLRAAVDANRKDDAYIKGGYSLVPTVGNFIETHTKATLLGGRLEMMTHATGGDGTVPRQSAIPHEKLHDDKPADWLNEKHGSLQNNPQTMDEIASLILHEQERDTMVFTAHATSISVTSQDALVGQDVVIRATDSATSKLVCTIESMTTAKSDTHTMPPDPDDPKSARLSLSGLPPGDYRLSVRGQGTNTVTDLVSVVDPSA
jgi:hypothetical protein